MKMKKIAAYFFAVVFSVSMPFSVIAMQPRRQVDYTNETRWPDKRLGARKRRLEYQLLNAGMKCGGVQRKLDPINAEIARREQQQEQVQDDHQPADADANKHESHGASENAEQQDQAEEQSAHAEPGDKDKKNKAPEPSHEQKKGEQYSEKNQEKVQSSKKLWHLLWADRSALGKAGVLVTGSCAVAATSYGIYALCFAKTEQEKSLQALEDLDAQARVMLEGLSTKYLADIFHKVAGDLTLLSDDAQQKLNESVVAFDVAQVNAKQEQVESAYQNLTACFEACKEGIMQSDKAHTNWRERIKQQLKALRENVLGIVGYGNK